MKPVCIAIILCVIFFIPELSCKWQPSMPGSQKTVKPSPANLPATTETGQPLVATNYDSLLTFVLFQENEVRKMPATLLAVSLFLKSSFDSISGCFRVAGKGTYNREHPASSWKQGMSLAASYDAKRWALYAKQWSNGAKIPFVEKISGEITYSKTLIERVQDDTMYVLVSVPIGSIIVK